MDDILGVDLSKHEELHVMRRSVQLSIGLHKVLHLFLAESQAHLLIVLFQNDQRLLSVREDVHDNEGSPFALCEHDFEGRLLRGNSLGHPVVDDISERKIGGLSVGFVEFDRDHSTSLDAMDLSLEAADMGDAGRFGAPWRDVPGRDVNGDAPLVWRMRDSPRGICDLEELLDLVESSFALLQVDIVEPAPRDGLNRGIALLVDAVQKLAGLCDRKARASDQYLVRHDDKDWTMGACPVKKKIVHSCCQPKSVKR